MPEPGSGSAGPLGLVLLSCPGTSIGPSRTVSSALLPDGDAGLETGEPSVAVLGTGSEEADSEVDVGCDGLAPDTSGATGATGVADGSPVGAETGGGGSAVGWPELATGAS